MPVNGRRGRPQGKCHRKQTARPRKAPGKGERVRQERTAPPATGAARQTPPGARPNRGGRSSRRRDSRPGSGGSGGGPAPPPGLAARGAPRGASQRNGRPVPVIHGDGQNPAYRPPGALSPTACPQACPPRRLRTTATTKQDMPGTAPHGVVLAGSRILGVCPSKALIPARLVCGEKRITPLPSHSRPW